jgi:DNA-binding NarL/FixJ family response regulator
MSIMKTIKFTKRKTEILDLLMRGFSNKEIAKKLSITEHTVKITLHNIREKIKDSQIDCNVNNRVGLAFYWLKIRGEL